MKKVFFKSMVGVAFVGMAMSSCVEVEDLYDPEYAAKIAEYRTQWVEKFGEIDPNEDWGFGTDKSSNAKALTRGVIKEDQFGLYNVDAPAAITDSEISDVLAVFNQKMENVVSESVNWSDFFVQHVSASNAEYVDKAGNPVVGSGMMNRMIVVKADGTEEHVYDFNAAIGSVVMMQDSGTDSFGYLNSTDSKQHYEYIVKCIKGEYYVGFDFYADGVEPNQQVDRDYTYNDWIVKIVPAKYKNAKRIICEDLGFIGDFDFNDIVFDASIVEDWSTGNKSYEAIITVQAAGGTLPVFIGGVDVHKALGVANDVMVNTGAGVSCPPAIFRIPVSSDNLRDIEVLVKGDVICLLKSPMGDAPQKICVTTDFVWPSERVNIKEKYPNFPYKGWAGSATDDEVKEEGDAPEGGEVTGSVNVDLEAVKNNGNTIPASYFTSTSKVELIVTVNSGVYVQFGELAEYMGHYFDGSHTFVITENLAEIQESGLFINGGIDQIESITIVNY